ncbi:hypothetical protein GQX74_002138 [Glossina fuscipes]|nr:hypothetical protein GQX74_002138 [Glossina fuscipes]
MKSGHKRWNSTNYLYPYNQMINGALFYELTKKIALHHATQWKKSECEAAKPVAAAAAKCPKCKPGCCSIGGLVAAELEFELGEAGESEPLPLLMLISWLWLEVFAVVTAATCDLEPNILSIVKREAAAAAAVAVLPAAEGRGGRSSSMIVTPDRDPSSEDGVCDGDVDSTIFKLCDDRPTFNGGVGGGDGLGVLTTVILNLEEAVDFDSRLPTSWPGELHNDDRILTLPEICDN